MKALFVSLLLLISAALAALWWVDFAFHAPGELEEPVTIVFPSGTGFEAIADTLAEKGVIRYPAVFKLQVFLRGQSRNFKAGEYEFAPHTTPAAAAQMIASGKSVIRQVTVAEGLMVSEVMEILRNTPTLSGEITLDIKEGELLPETYFYSYGDKRNDLLMRMKKAMDKVLAEAWETRATDLPLSSPQEALVLASIVEKETSIAAERAQVASVYVNRLKKGMLLQADPTTVYAITQGKHKMDRPLTLMDLKIESPYNTYYAKGLPPGPIANPGKAAILAALNPAKTDYFYFVATGNGGHNFARTDKEHAENVKAYRLAQRRENNTD